RPPRLASTEGPSPMASTMRPEPPRPQPARALGAAVALAGLLLYQPAGLDASGPIRPQDQAPSPSAPVGVGNDPEAPADPDVAPAGDGMGEADQVARLERTIRT